MVWPVNLTSPQINLTQNETASSQNAPASKRARVESKTRSRQNGRASKHSRVKTADRQNAPESKRPRVKTGGRQNALASKQRPGEVDDDDGDGRGEDRQHQGLPDRQPVWSQQVQRDAGQDDGGEGDQGLHALQARGLRAPAQEFAAVAWETLSRLQQCMTANGSQEGGVDRWSTICRGAGGLSEIRVQISDKCCTATSGRESRLDVRQWPDSHVWPDIGVDFIEVSVGGDVQPMSGNGRI